MYNTILLTSVVCIILRARSGVDFRISISALSKCSALCEVCTASGVQPGGESDSWSCKGTDPFCLGMCGRKMCHPVQFQNRPLYPRRRTWSFCCSPSFPSLHLAVCLKQLMSHIVHYTWHKLLRALILLGLSRNLVILLNSYGKVDADTRSCTLSVINPRHVCTVRVAMLGLYVCVCVCVCPSVTTILPLQATRRPKRNTNTTSILHGDFVFFKRYGVKSPNEFELTVDGFCTLPRSVWVDSENRRWNDPDSGSKRS